MAAHLYLKKEKKKNPTNQTKQSCLTRLNECLDTDAVVNSAGGLPCPNQSKLLCASVSQAGRRATQGKDE